MICAASRTIRAKNEFAYVTPLNRAGGGDDVPDRPVTRSALSSRLRRRRGAGQQLMGPEN